MNLRNSPWAQAHGLWMRCRRPGLRYGLAASLALGLVLTPILLRLLAGALDIVAGGPVLNYALADLAVSGRGVLLLVLWSLVTSVLEILVVGGPVLITSAARTGTSLCAREAVRPVLTGLGRIRILGACKLGLFTTVWIPVVVAFASLLAGLVLAPFGGLPQRPALPVPDSWLPWLAVAGGAVLVLAYLLYVRWCFAVHVLLLEGTTLSEAMQRSAVLGRGHRWRHAGQLLLHHVGGAVLLGALTLLLGALDRLVLTSLAGTEAFRIALAVLLVLNGVIATLAGIWWIGWGAALTGLLYEEAGGSLAPAATATRDASPARLRPAFVLGAVAVFGFATALALDDVDDALTAAERPTLVTAHRGSSGEAPENTLAALRLAIVDEADFAEIDVQEAADGQVVVVHDHHLGRLAGLDRNVWDMTADELADVDVGSHFSPAFASERIPTLAQAIEVVKNRLRLNIEIKTHGRERGDVSAAVVGIVAEHEFRDQCVITSLDASALAAVRRADPEIPIGAIVSASIGNMRALDVDFYSVQPLVATPAFIRSAHRSGRDVHVWTLNTRADMELFTDRGADNLITDHPRVAREMLDARTPADAVTAAVTRLFDTRTTR